MNYKINKFLIDKNCHIIKAKTTKISDPITLDTKELENDYLFPSIY